MGYDRLEQIREGVLGDGLVGNFWEEGLPLCVQMKLECLHGCSSHNFLWQLVPVRDHSNAERMLAATGLTPLLVNLESLTSKPNVGAAKTASQGKSRRPCKISYMQIRSPWNPLRTREIICSRLRAISYGTWFNPFTNFTASFWTLSSAWQSQERIGEDACIAYSRYGRKKRFVQWEENTRGQGREGSL